MKKIPIYGPDKIWYEDVEKERQVERRTYLKGSLESKYKGTLSEEISNQFARSDFYAYKLFETIIRIDEFKGIRKTDEKPFVLKSAFSVDENYLPVDTSIVIYNDNEEKCYNARLRNVKISELEFIRELKQIEDNEYFGTLKAKITGYVLDYITETYIDKELRVEKVIIGWWPPDGPETKCIQDAPTGKSEIKTVKTKEYIRFEYYNLDCSTYWGDWQFKQCIEGSFTGEYEIKTTEAKILIRYQFYKSDCSTYWGKWNVKECIEGAKTGKFEIKDGWFYKRYIRYEYCKKDCSTYWGKWIFKEKIEYDYNFDTGRIILWLLFFLFAILWIRFIGLPSLIVLLLIGVLLYFINTKFHFFYNILSWFTRLISLVFFIGIISSFVSYFLHGFKSDIFPKRNDYTQTNNEKELTDTLNNDIINHHREWKDYNQKIYNCNLKIRLSDFNKSKRFNASLGFAGDFKYIYNQIANFDESSLNLIFKEFDSLRVINHYQPNSLQFANMITSCIQDIPYALILNGRCSPYDVDDNSIKQLLIEGCDCKGSVPNGLQTPVEFMSNLKGDCDTRSLLLFVIFKKFGYKTLLLASEYYRHAIIALHIPNYTSDGLQIKHNNENYYVWETTARGIPLGILSPEVDNMNLWSIYLK